MNNIIKKSDRLTDVIKLPYTKTPVTISTWNIKQHGVLAMAFESDDTLKKYRAVMQIMSDVICDDINVYDLPTIELDYLFLRARAISIGENTQITVTHNKTGQTKILNIDLTKIDITPKEERNYTIKLVNKDGTDSGNYLIMKNITAGDRIRILETKEENPDLIEELEVAILCVDKICDENECKSAADMPTEIRGLIENMSPRQYEAIDEFVNTMPIIRHEVEVKKIFGEEDGLFVLEGLESFFG